MSQDPAQPTGPPRQGGYGVPPGQTPGPTGPPAGPTGPAYGQPGVPTGSGPAVAHGSSQYAAGQGSPPYPDSPRHADPTGATTPPAAPSRDSTQAMPTSGDRRDLDRRDQGYPQDRQDDHGHPHGPGDGHEDYREPVDEGPVLVRSVDGVGSTLLLLAGACAAGSMLLPWREDGDTSTGFELATDLQWEPLAVLIGGGILLLMGLLLAIPMRGHRGSGLLAFIGAVIVTVGVLNILISEDFEFGFADIGFHLALGCAGLGLLGALKGIVTPARKVKPV